MCLRCSWFFHGRICLRCFMLFFSSECVCAVYGTFTSEYVYAVLLFFSSECVYAVYRTFTSECICAVYGTFTSECVFAVFTLLWYLHERICLRCLCYFSRANVFTLFMVLSRANMFIKLFFLMQRCLRWVMCSFLLANMFSLFMAPYNMSNMSCKRIWLRWFMEFFLKLLCSRSYAFLLLVLFMLLARSGFTRSVFIFCLSCAWLNQIGVAALSVKIEALEKQVSADSVDRVLVCVRQLAGRPIGLSDGTAIVAALESLADVSTSAGHVDFKRYKAILRQCQPLAHDPRLPAVVTQLLGDDESKKIAGQIQKILKSDHLFSAPQVHGSPFPAPARAPGYLRHQGSGRGRYTPYGYGSCNNNYASRGFNTTRCYNCRKTGHRIADCPALKRA